MTASETPDQPRYHTPVHGYLAISNCRALWYPSAELAELNAGPNGLVYVGPESLGQWLEQLNLRPHRPLATQPPLAPYLTDLRGRFDGQGL